eukprot:g42339.t1
MSWRPYFMVQPDPEQDTLECLRPRPVSRIPPDAPTYLLEQQTTYTDSQAQPEAVTYPGNVGDVLAYSGLVKNSAANLNEYATTITDFIITTTDVRAAFFRVNPWKAIGPDGASGHALRSYTDQLVVHGIPLAPHSFMEHLENKDTYIRLLFIEFSSTFDTSNPTKLISKLRDKNEEVSLASVSINGVVVEMVKSFKVLGVNFTNNLSWFIHINATVKKAYEHLYFLRRLKKFGMSTMTLTRQYGCTVVSTAASQHQGPRFDSTLSLSIIANVALPTANAARPATDANAALPTSSTASSSRGDSSIQPCQVFIVSPDLPLTEDE